MASAGYPVEVVIQTATALFEGRLDAREAVTLLATQAEPARAAGAALARQDPRRAAAYSSILRHLGRSLRSALDASPQPAHLRAVLGDLARVVRALPSDPSASPGGDGPS